MTDQTTSELDGMDDIKLITSFLNGHLDPERAEAVRRRLEEDAAFRDFAAPLLLAWSVPRRIERKPRPEGELEHEWAAFVKRTGFPRRPPAPPPPIRRRWPLWLALVVGGVLATNAYVQTQFKPEGSDVPFSPVPYDTRWIALIDSTSPMLRSAALLVETRAGTVSAGESEFSITARVSWSAAIPNASPITADPRTPCSRTGPTSCRSAPRS